MIKNRVLRCSSATVLLLIAISFAVVGEELLDLNTATVEQLEALPGIGRVLAERIVDTRNAAGGFRSVQDLDAVPGIAKKRIAQISPWVQVLSPPSTGQAELLPPTEGTGLSIEKEVPENEEEEERFRFVPAGGEVSVRTLGRSPTAEDLDSLAQSAEEQPFLHSFYLYERTRLNWKDGRVGWLLLRRDRETAFTADHLSRHLRKWWAASDSVPGLDHLVLGHYRLGFGQGLLFADTLEFETRRLKARATIPREDASTLENSYHRGVAAQTQLGNASLTGFFSYSVLDGSAPANAFFDEDLNFSRDNTGALDSPRALAENDNLGERLMGFHASWSQENRGTLGVTVAQARYSKNVDPQGSVNVAGVPNRLEHAFRGDANTLWGVDGDLFAGPFDFFGEYGRSHASSGSEGQSWILTGSWELEPWETFLRVYRYDPDFFSRHSSVFALADENTLGQNERGLAAGTEWKKRDVRLFFTGGFGKSLGPLFSGNSASALPPFPEDLARLQAEAEMKVSDDWTLLYQESDEWRERFVDASALTGNPSPDRRQIRQSRFKRRYQATWRTSKTVQTRFRYEQTVQGFPSFHRSQNASLFFAELKAALSDSLTLQPRIAFFDSDASLLGEDVFASQIEPVWHNVYSPASFGFGQKGVRLFIQLTQKFSKGLVLWMRYSVTRIPDRDQATIANAAERDEAIRSRSQDARVQLEYRWGIPDDEE